MKTDWGRFFCRCRPRPVAAGCLMAVLLAAPPVQAMTFGEALAQARHRSPALAAAHQETVQHRELEAAARGLYFPTVTVEGSYTCLNDDVTIDLNPLRRVMTGLHGLPAGVLPSFELGVQDQEYQKMAATAQWPIFTGGQITAANRAAAATLDAAEARERSGVAKLSSEVVTRYFGLRLARDVVAVHRQVLSALDRHLDHAVKLEQQGMIARAERLHASVARDEARRQVLAAEHDTAIAQAGLQNSLGAATPVDPEDELFIVRSLEDPAHFQQLARDRNPLLRQLAAGHRAAGQGLEKAKGTRWPQVYLFARQELMTDDLTVLEPEWAAGIGARLTLFDGGSRRHRIGAARALTAKAGHLEEKVRKDLSTLIDQHYHEIAKAAEQFEALESALVLAVENLRVRQRAFEEGLATSLDVVDAQLSLAKIRIARLSALFDFDVALAGLLEAAGSDDAFDDYRLRGEKNGPSIHNDLVGVGVVER
jgi:outer membrane protein TolC